MNMDLKIYEEERPWGKFRRFTENMISTVKIITVNKGEELSLQSHQKRAEFWKVIKGSGTFFIDNDVIEANIDKEQYIPTGAKHRMKASNEGLQILEIGLGEFDENDIVRYEDKYGRV